MDSVCPFLGAFPELAKAFVDQKEDDQHSAHEIAAWAMIINTIYNLDITKTRS